MLRRLRRPVGVHRACWFVATATVCGAGWWGALALSGTGVLLGGASTVALVAVLTATTAGLVPHVRRRLFPLSRSVTRRIDAVVWALAYATLDPVAVSPTLAPRPPTDDELCRSWCATYTALQTSTSRRKHLALVRERRAILDELARRNPSAFLAWLVDATPGDDPGPSMRVDGVAPPVIDWDELIGGSDPE